MPLTRTGNFMSRDDALSHAAAHDHMADAYLRIGKQRGGARLDEAKKLAKREREQAEEYRRIAAGVYSWRGAA